MNFKKYVNVTCDMCKGMGFYPFNTTCPQCKGIGLMEIENEDLYDIDPNEDYY